MTQLLTPYDRWGLIQIPTSTDRVFTPRFGGWGNPANVPTSDPTLAVILDFVAVFLSTDAQTYAAWTAIAGGSFPQPVQCVLPHDPNDVVFNTNNLPALYMWRADAKQEYAADDWLRETTTVKALWVFPLATQENQRIRQPFGHVFAKAMNVAIERGRTPNWKQAEDTNPASVDEGSLFYDWAGFESLKLTSWRKAKLVIPMRGDTAQEYPAIEFTFVMEENLEYGLGRFKTLAGVDATVNVQTSIPYTVWQPGRTYALGDFVVPAPPNNFVYQANGNGYVGLTPPTWPTTVGATVKDGSVVWTCQALQTRLVVSGPLSPT